MDTFSANVTRLSASLSLSLNLCYCLCVHTLAAHAHLSPMIRNRWGGARNQPGRLAQPFQSIANRSSTPYLGERRFRPVKHLLMMSHSERRIGKAKKDGHREVANTTKANGPRTGRRGDGENMSARVDRHRFTRRPIAVTKAYILKIVFGGETTTALRTIAVF